ncbi:MAG: response regulator [Victivallales bacterium]
MKKILILDDEKSLRLILRNIIERTGEYEIFESESLQHAFVLCNENKFDAIFLDHNVTGGVGWQIAEEIRKNPAPYGNPKIVGMSGSVPYNGSTHLFDFFMEKPFSAVDIMPKISGILGQSRADQPTKPEA